MSNLLVNPRLNAFLRACGLTKPTEAEASAEVARKPWIEHGSHLTVGFVFREWIDAMMKIAADQYDEEESGVFRFAPLGRHDEYRPPHISDHTEFTDWLSRPDISDRGRAVRDDLFAEHDARYQVA